MATKQVKTYRVLHEGMKVGNSVRHVGDLMPEAADFGNLRVYLSTRYLEEIWVDESVIEDFKKELEEREKASQVPETSDADEGEDSGSVKTVTKKKVAKKTVKKSARKVKNNVIAERSV